MRDATPQTIRLQDYTPPAFLISTVALEVDIREGQATVRATLRLARNPAHPDAAAPLVLDGRSLELGPPRQRALLAVLLLHANDVVSTDRLGDALWPTGLPKSASKAIHVYVSGLRKVFGEKRDARAPQQDLVFIPLVSPGHGLCAVVVSLLQT